MRETPPEPVRVILLRALIVFAASFVAVAGTVDGQTVSPSPPTVAEGFRLEQMIDEVLDRHARGQSDGRRFVVLERELNAYLRFQGAGQLPSSVTQPRLVIEDADRITASVTIDLDAIREARARGTLDLLSYLGGKVPVVATGTLRAHDGIGQVSIERVQIAGVSVPATVLHELVRYYTRGDVFPQGFDLRDPFTLPYGIRTVSVDAGRAVVVQ